MKTKEKTKKKTASVTEGKQVEQKPKSPMVLFREKYPNGYGGGIIIHNMKAVLK